MRGDFTPGTRWTVDLWPYDAIVLFDWLMTVDFDQIPVEHKAQRQALADLLAVLETQVPVAGVTQMDRRSAPTSFAPPIDAPPGRAVPATARTADPGRRHRT